MIRMSHEFHSAEERRLVVSLWAFGVVFGLSQAWSWRFYIEPDGVSYIEIAHAYIARDFAHAVNAYWSPLYSWLLALVISFARVPEYSEATALHLVNFFVYLLALAAFAFFFSEFTALLYASADQTLSRTRWAWNVFGYSLFFFAALLLVGVGIDQPDLIVLAASLLATGLLIRMKRGAANWAAYVALGYPNRRKKSADRWVLPLPATYIIDRNGLVMLSYVDADHTTRLEPAEIITALTHLRARAIQAGRGIPDRNNR